MRDLPVPFHFGIIFPPSLEIPFREVSGLTTEVEFETLQEGGVNNVEYKLPVKTKHGNLVLKRALQPITTSLLEPWLKAHTEYGYILPIVPFDLVIYLYNEQQTPIRGWCCTRAWPVKWETDPLDAEKNCVLIETIELAYQELKRLI